MMEPIRIREKEFPNESFIWLSWHWTYSPCSAFLAPTGQTCSLEGHQSNPIPSSTLFYFLFCLFQEILDNLGTRETKTEGHVLCSVPPNQALFSSLKIFRIFNTFGHQSNSICVPFYYFISLQFPEILEVHVMNLLQSLI